MTYTSAWAWVNVSSTYWTVAELTCTLTNITSTIGDDCDGI
jgi:hypothetical protein